MAKQNFSVARIETRTRATVGKFERHIERKNDSYENINVDLSRTPMNVSFKSCGELTYNEHLDKMIAAGTVSLKGLKPDATVPIILNRTAAMNMPAGSMKKLSILQKSYTAGTILYLQ